MNFSAKISVLGEKQNGGVTWQWVGHGSGKHKEKIGNDRERDSLCRSRDTTSLEEKVDQVFYGVRI